MFCLSAGLKNSASDSSLSAALIWGPFQWYLMPVLPCILLTWIFWQDALTGWCFVLLFFICAAGVSCQLEVTWNFASIGPKVISLWNNALNWLWYLREQDHSFFFFFFLLPNWDLFQLALKSLYLDLGLSTCLFALQEAGWWVHAASNFFLILPPVWGTYKSF